MKVIYPQLDGVKINEDRTLPTSLIQAIRKAYDYLADETGTGETAKPPNGGGGNGDGGGLPESDGVVTGITSASEVGTRYVDPLTRLVHLTVGFIPTVLTPRTVTYLISEDAGAHWTWVGSQYMQTAGQMLKMDRLAIADDANWKVAAVAGNWGGDAVPFPNASLLTLYPGAVVSSPFPVAGLSAPPSNGGITATIGACSNVVGADGFTQYGLIPGVIYTDPVNSIDFFVRITVENLDASLATVRAEEVHGGTQITGGTHTEKDLLVIYTPGLAWVRYRFYTASRESQGGGDFTDPATNTLQMVRYNGAAPANHYDVPIVIPPFTPIDPNDVFNVVSVTGSEVGPKYQDEKAGLHTVVGIVPVIDVDYSKPHTVTIWLDFGNGKPVWQGSFSNNYAGEIIRIGDQTLGSDGTRKSGDIWVPANAGQGTWKVWCAPGNLPQNVSPTSYPNNTFTVIPVRACSPTGITNCHFIADPSTSDPITYYKDGLGHWFWEYFRLEWTPPTQAAEPDFWFAMITIQKGATISGTWTPAPDPEGRNADPYLNYLGRVHDQVMTIAGLAPDQTTIMQRTGAYPSTWIIPPSQNVDLTPYLYREFRFLMYSVSRLGTDSSGSGGAGTYTLQTSCWPGGKSFYILTPVPKVGDLDLRYANPNTIGDGLKGGGGTVIDIDGTAISTYIPDDAILARHMHEDSITAANKALAANSIVDNNVSDVNISKLIFGTNIFTGDVILSRGSTKPVILLQNSGINLFGVSDSTAVPPGSGGLTSQPNVAIQSSGISLFAGATSKSVTITSNAITFWSVNGDNTKPYATMSNSGLFVTDGAVTPNTLALSNTGLTVIDNLGAKITVNAGIITLLMARSVAGNGNTQALINGSGASFTTGTGTGLMELIMDNTGLFLRRGGVNGPSVSFSATAITLQNNGSSGPQVNITSGQITIANGTSSVTLTPTTVTIVNGSFTSPVINGGSLNITTTQGTVSINNTTAGIQVSLGGSDTARVASNLISIYSGSIGSELTPTTLLVGRFSSTSMGFNTNSGSSPNGLVISGVQRIDLNGIYRGSLQFNDHCYAGDFGIMPGGAAGPSGAVGVSGSFVAGAKTVTVWGGIITSIV